MADRTPIVAFAFVRSVEAERGSRAVAANKMLVTSKSRLAWGDQVTEGNDGQPQRC